MIEPKEAIDLLNTAFADILPEANLNFRVDHQQLMVVYGHLNLTKDVSFDLKEFDKYKTAESFFVFIKNRIRNSQQDMMQTLLDSMRKVN